MTDNRTTELREKLDDLIIELDRLDIALDLPASDMTIGEYEQEREKLLDGFTQAIAATLGVGECAQCAIDMGAYADSLCDPLKERVNELLRCLENDWHIRASWDGLRKFWCIELTEEGVKLRDATHGTLTAEQVRETVEKHWHDLPDEYDMSEATALPEYSYDWQAIVDELNQLGSGTCNPVETEVITYYDEYGHDAVKVHVMECDECGGTYEHVNGSYSRCPNCGRKVVSA